MSFKEHFVSLLFVFVTCLCSLNANCFARELTDLSFEISSNKQGGEAKQEAFDQATEMATQKLTEELLGADRAAKYWPTLKAKLLKNSTRFVLFIKGAPPTQVGDTTKIVVSLRLSPDNLESLLRDDGALTASGVKVLPMVEILDSRGAKYIWWAYSGDGEKTTPSQDLFKKFLAQMAAKFSSKKIYVLDPTGASFRMSVPAAYRAETLRREDQMLFAQYLKADVVVSGRIAVVRGLGGDLKLNYDLQVWESKSGRGITELQRAESVASESPKVILSSLEQADVGVMDELLKKLSETLANGELNLNVVRVAVDGTLNYHQQTDFKRQLGQLREIKVLKERLFAPGQVQYEAETSVTGQEFGFRPYSPFASANFRSKSKLC